MPKRKVWMMVSKDDYQLPLAVAESSEQLAAMVNATAYAVRDSASRYDRGITKYPAYISIERPDDWSETEWLD